MKTITFGGGCFWGLEELFRARPGVTDTEVGYAGGQNAHPTYESHPGHAEAIKVTYDESKTSAWALLDYFFAVHDPTTLNRQGNDVGSSYRSVIFISDVDEKKTAEDAVKRNQVYWKNPIVTTIEPLGTFWSAEEYHQDYLQKHPGGYTCHFERPRPYYGI